MQYPILGIGVGNWKIKSIQYAGDSVVGYTVPYHAHNDFLQIFAEIGIIGGLAYLMIYLIPIYRILIKLKDRVLDNLNLMYLLIISEFRCIPVLLVTTPLDAIENASSCGSVAWEVPE